MVGEIVLYMLKKCSLAVILCLVMISAAQAGKLAILIDDFGYRLQDETQVLQMPLGVSVAIFPHAPYSQLMMEKAHQQGRQILIHLPMAPLSKQPLEKDTLTPAMSFQQVQRIVDQAIQAIPYAVGINNHMGSAMTSSLGGMQNVMQAMNAHSLFFLDSMTIGNSQTTTAAQGTHVKVIKRNVFLDDVQNDAAITEQFQRAVALARRQGYAIAIGHPHQPTIHVLQRELGNLPADIELVRPGDLLSEAPYSATSKPLKPRRPAFTGIKQCIGKQPLTSVHADILFKLLQESLLHSALADVIRQQWNIWQTTRRNSGPAQPPSAADK